ncbi:MAG: ribosome-associated translation inhibitor RaiA [Oscillospiraceae bacterium]|jgi:putative sigma-54 modulation protein|nr:ribosome-associated translation inhibitor RaiA [Clostridiales bacterium]MDD4096672.1 ribosome-associated translation inhibitor RaiA [Oscillospiraceae bacterium]
MKVTTQGSGIHVGERLEEKIESKLSKFEKHFGEEGIFNIKVVPERELKRVELTLKLQNRIFRAEARDEEILTAVDRTIDKLESQIRRQKTRIEKQIRDYSYVKEYLKDVPEDVDEVLEEEKKIIKRKSFELVPMSPDDAVLQMEMLGHSFLVYLDAETGNVCVVYKRKDGHYGLIEPTY